MDLSSLTPLASLITLIGFLALTITNVYYSRKSGINKTAQDDTSTAINVIQVYKDQVQQLRDENEKLRDTQIQQGKAIAALQENLSLKDKKIEELNAILAGKDPGQIEYMKKMEELRIQTIKFIDKSNEFMQRVDKDNQLITSLLRNRDAIVFPKGKKIQVVNKQ